MTDTEYLNLAEAALLRIEQAADRINDDTDADIDAARNGGVITLAFASGSQIVVNLQKPLHEIWLAARAGGYHYKHDGCDNQRVCPEEHYIEHAGGGKVAQGQIHLSPEHKPLGAVLRDFS